MIFPIDGVGESECERACADVACVGVDVCACVLVCDVEIICVVTMFGRSSCFDGQCLTQLSQTFQMLRPDLFQNRLFHNLYPQFNAQDGFPGRAKSLVKTLPNQSPVDVWINPSAGRPPRFPL